MPSLSPHTLWPGLIDDDKSLEHFEDANVSFIPRIAHLLAKCST